MAVRDLTLIVSGKTRQRYRALGFEGMHFKWDRDWQKWHGPISLKNLEAQQTLGKLREEERRRREYYGGDACNGRLRSFVLCALCASAIITVTFRV